MKFKIGERVWYSLNEEESFPATVMSNSFREDATELSDASIRLVIKIDEGFRESGTTIVDVDSLSKMKRRTIQ